MKFESLFFYFHVDYSQAALYKALYCIKHYISKRDLTWLENNVAKCMQTCFHPPKEKKIQLLNIRNKVGIVRYEVAVMWSSVALVIYE